VTATTRRVQLEGGQVATLTSDHHIVLEAEPERGEGLMRLSARLTGTPQNAADIGAANGGVKDLIAGVRYQVPFDLLLPEYQVAAIEALFPQDRGMSQGWKHVVSQGSDTSVESLWDVASWFTGDGHNFRSIREQNGLQDEELRPGQSLVVPAAVLRPALRSVLPPAEESLLTFQQHDGQEYAVYHLQAGEALYSAVVVRFTGRIYADDVNSLAQEIARASNIPDVTDIPIGYPVRIPIDLLLPEFLPAGHPRRQEYEASLLASNQFTNPVRADRLQGVTVILDAGHGGRDVGATSHGVWESLYVYDVMLRTRRLLETVTSATVYTTTRDGAGYRIAELDVLPRSHGHEVLTQPPYPIEDAKVGVNLRWYLANSIFDRLRARHVDSGKVIFLSIHADSLHPSLRGGMVYIPGASGRVGRYGKSGPAYASRREVRHRPVVAFTSRQRVRSEGLSRELAEKIVHGFRRTGLEVHPYKPIRDRIVRSRRWSYVPAVLRYNEVPAEALIEVCNLNNPQDRELIQTRKFRQQVAEAIVHGILDYYGYQVSPEVMAAGSVAAMQR
jgi:N-acetylmuramoyl-L-alanine amidase